MDIQPQGLTWRGLIFCEKAHLPPRTPQQRCLAWPVIEKASWACRIQNSKPISTAPGISPLALIIYTDRSTPSRRSLPSKKSAGPSNYPQVTAGQLRVHGFVSSSHEAPMRLASTSCVALTVTSGKRHSALCVRHHNHCYYPDPQPDSPGIYNSPA